MEVLNNSKVLSLHEIVIKFFNNSFLSDITFTIDQKEIRAHSFILMSRSVVYQEQFEHNQGEQKLIPIQQYDYASFYEFLRFIYTDECTITRQNVIAVFQLSIIYNVGKLTELVIAHIEKEYFTNEKYRLYEFCVLNEHQELSNRIEPFIGMQLYEILQSDYFLQSKPLVVEAILKMEFVGTGSKPVKEIDMLSALMKWIKRQCLENKMKLGDRRMQFDHLIRLIRFPVCEPGELKQCIEQSEKLFTDSDIQSFSDKTRNSLWILNARQTYTNSTNGDGNIANWFDGLTVDESREHRRQHCPPGMEGMWHGHGHHRRHKYRERLDANVEGSNDFSFPHHPHHPPHPMWRKEHRRQRFGGAP